MMVGVLLVVAIVMDCAHIKGSRKQEGQQAVEEGRAG